MASFRSLKGLADLLSRKDESDLEDDDFECESPKDNYECNITNSTFCKAEGDTILDKEKLTKSYNCNKIVQNSKNIWDDDEILHEDDDEALLKEIPEYEMMYEQSVTPDDVFLQLSGKGPGSDSCECLLVKIKLPGIYSKDEVNLNTATLKLVCKTENYYLNLDLPKEVDPTKCSAKWDQTQSLLVVKLFFETKNMLFSS